MDGETRRFQMFQKDIALNTLVKEKSPEVLDRVKRLLDIEDDIEDLRQIKDIREELSIMSSLFHVQKEILQAMDHILREERACASRFEQSSTESRFTASTKNEDSGKERAFHSPMLTAVNRNIEEVQRLERFAERGSREVFGIRPQIGFNVLTWNVTDTAASRPEAQTGKSTRRAASSTTERGNSKAYEWNSLTQVI